MMAESEDKVSVNVWGCCVSRDSVAFRQNKYVVPRYVQVISPLTVMSGKPLDLKIEDFSAYPNVHNFTKRCICLDANKNAIDYLVADKGTWLLFDIAEIRRTVYFWPEADIVLTKNSKLCQMLDVLAGFTNGEIPSEIYPSKLSDEELTAAVEKLCDKFLEHFPPQNIILNEFYNVDTYLNANNELQEFSETEKGCSRLQNKVLKLANEVCKRKFKGCHIITMPANNFADEKQRWGLSSLHYTALYYDYVERCISAIVSAASREEETERLSALYGLFNEKMLSCCMWARKNSYRKDKHNAEARLEVAEKRASDAENKVLVVQKNNKNLELRKAELEKSCSELDGKIKELKRTEQSLLEANAELDKRVTTLSGQIKATEATLSEELQRHKLAEQSWQEEKAELDKSVKTLSAKIKAAEDELSKELLRRKQAERELSNIRVSKSYKVGRFVTFLPRKLRDYFKRLRKK